MDAIRLMTRFQQLERDCDLFEQTVKGEPWWDSVRYDVHTFLSSVLLERRAAPTPAPLWRRAAAGALAGAMRAKLYRELRRKQERVLLIRAARHREGKVFRDIIVDPIGALLGEDTYSIDTLPRRYHVPFYLQSRRSGSVPQDVMNTIIKILDAFDIAPEQAASLEETIRFRRFVFESELYEYNRLFTRARPKMIVLVQNGIEKALFKVARMNGIPTAELQHGLMGFTHPAYSYPEDIDYSSQETFPDIFLSFGEFWDRSCHYPAGNRVPIGNDSYFVKPLPAATARSAMVISTGIHHPTLVEWVRKFAELSPERTIVYKLHPGQQPLFHRIESEFGDLPNVDVFSGQIPASKLLKQVSHVIGICSTVMYEALQAGRGVCIIPEQDYLAHADILQMPGVLVTPTPKDLNDALADSCRNPLPPRFFEPFDAGRARSVLESAMRLSKRKGQEAT